MKGLEISLTIPDLWQQEAVRALREGCDVVVHAPTGAGKTFIFELLYPQWKGQAVFTVPTRALANDKLAEWRAKGWDVGIATGDVAWRTDARVVVATLETQKGRFLRREGPALLVIDEYQMIADPVRGMNYELALALAPPGTQLLLLSGSVANPGDVVAWLRRLGRDAILVAHQERPVPLDEVDLASLPDRAPAAVRGFWPRHIYNALAAGLGPVLVFAPRRHAAEALAQSLAFPAIEPLTLTPAQRELAGATLARLLRQRVAFHHSGLRYELRAGLIEPLAKNGQLAVVVATMGLAAGINFSMRSVLVTGTRYVARGFEREVAPDELLQMAGRAGRRGLDEAGFLLVTGHVPRLHDGRPRRLQRAEPLDWPALLGVMHAAVVRGENPLAAAVELAGRCYSASRVALGLEHARATGPMPCGLWVDMERARFARRAVLEMRNTRGEWEPRPAQRLVPLGQVLVRAGGRWQPALRFARALDGIGTGMVCRLDGGPGRKYGRELVLGFLSQPANPASPVILARWLRPKLKVRRVSRARFEEEVLGRLAEFTGGGRLHALVLRNARLVARLDFSAVEVPAFVDSHGCALRDPELRETRPPACRDCPQFAAWCSVVPVGFSPAYAWRRLGLIDERGVPTRRGVVCSFFNGGEGLAIAAALEDASYAIDELVFDLANVRAGHRFAGDDSPYGGRLGLCCQAAFERADYPGYLALGVPIDYGAGAAEVVRALVLENVPRHKLLTDLLRPGDLERVLVEWRSLLRHIVRAPDLDWERWRALQRAAAQFVDLTAPPVALELPSLTAGQLRRETARPFLAGARA